MRRLFVLVAITACGNTRPTSTATVTVEPLPSVSASPVPAPPVPVSATAFLDAGCKETGDASLLDCKGARIPGIARCREPLHVLAVTFEPRAIVAECFVERDAGGIRQTGCMVRSSVELVVATSSGFITVSSLAELAKTFAPVTSPAEAIAFAVVTSGAELIKTARPPIGVSEVHATGDGWSVRLFTTQVCGCSHPTWSIDYDVSPAGTVTEAARKVVFEESKMRGLCVD